MQQQKQKKIPVRRCVGCNAQRPKRELVRVVRSPEGEISIDLRGKAPGHRYLFLLLLLQLADLISK